MADEAETVVQPLTRYKEDVNVFSAPAEGYGINYISAMPSEILNEILSYLILDHDPERAIKKHEAERKAPWVYNDPPHVFLSLSAMSRHFRDHVEQFCRLHLMAHKDTYHFKTTAELEEQKKVRRSERLKAKSSTTVRCHRRELVNRLQYHCIDCGCWVMRRAVMANGVACCTSCDGKRRRDQLTLSEALKKFDLRDWMLIASREPGPRAKHKDLPIITYGTVRTGTPFMNGMCISYRFFRRDVAMIARAVHGDVEAHMTVKNSERRQRKIVRRDREYRKLKVEFHEDMKDIFPEDAEHHQERLEYYQDPKSKAEYDDDTDSEHELFSDGQDWGDNHKRLCIEDDCEICDEINMRKYCPWW